MERKRLNDFVVKGVLSGVLTVDVDALASVPREEFRRMYIEEMQTYFDNHPNPKISCCECSEEISTPSDLFRRYGINLHEKCFQVVYTKERDTDIPDARRFFDLVLNSLDVDLEDDAPTRI